MLPSYEDFLSGSGRWNGIHKGISYELSWHGRSDYSPQGTWCWYIYVNQEQFYPDDWAKLRLERQDKQFHEGGNFHRHYDYDSFPDVEPHGGWTFGEMETYLGKDGKEYEQVKVGCDYAHLWDREGGYWQGKSEIESDVKRSIDLLVQMFPNRRERCSYTGRFGSADEMYTAKNGARVLKSEIEKIKQSSGWEHWAPADAA